jgi:uncharacterized alkaline shock family protein YloU
MSEQGQQRSDSPLESERGRTTVNGSVVSKIAGLAVEEVEGIRMGGSISRGVGGFLGNVTGSQTQTLGISAEVGRIETAIDVTMGIEYGGNISRLAEEVRNRVTDRVENLTGLRVAELNVTVSDVVFPGGEEEGILLDRPLAQRVEEIGAGGREREAAHTEPAGSGAERVEATTGSGGGIGEETRAQSVPPEEDETAELRFDDEETERRREG